MPHCSYDFNDMSGASDLSWEQMDEVWCDGSWPALGEAAAATRGAQMYERGITRKSRSFCDVDEQTTE